MRSMHPPVWEGVLTALQDIFVGGFPADKVIQRQLKAHRKWGSSDRRLFAECVYDIVRWWRRILDAAGEFFPAGVNKNLAAKAVAIWCDLNGVSVRKELVPEDLNLELARSRWASKDLPRTVRESMPDWLDELGFEELPDTWDETLPVLNTVAPVYLRANTLKTSAAKLVSRLATDQIEAVAESGDGLRLTKRANVFLSSAFKEGQFEVQDLNSQRVALALAPQAGDRVVDACAGAGGKSLHLAALMGNKGKIIALDVHEKKLAQLRERSTRAGATCIETRLIENNKTIKRLHDSAERVLLDVPCSGLGVIRRNPDSKWKLSMDEILRLRELQASILKNYAALCKKGGRLVYSTCSILPSENKAQVDRFLEGTGDSWRLVSQETHWPKADGPDGFFIAVLERT